jgi:hypothetical protein
VINIIMGFRDMGCYNPLLDTVGRSQESSKGLEIMMMITKDQGLEALLAECPAAWRAGEEAGKDLLTGVLAVVGDRENHLEGEQGMLGRPQCPQSGNLLLKKGGH